MIEFNKAEWVTPAKAAEEMSKRAGYQITTDDIRQLRRIGRITNVMKLGKRITLYNLEEIRTVKPPNKRKKRPLGEPTKEAA